MATQNEPTQPCCRVMQLRQQHPLYEDNMLPYHASMTRTTTHAHKLSLSVATKYPNLAMHSLLHCLPTSFSHSMCHCKHTFHCSKLSSNQHCLLCHPLPVPHQPPAPACHQAPAAVAAHRLLPACCLLPASVCACHVTRLGREVTDEIFSSLVHTGEVRHGASRRRPSAEQQKL